MKEGQFAKHGSIALSDSDGHLPETNVPRRRNGGLNNLQLVIRAYQSVDNKEPMGLGRSAQAFNRLIVQLPTRSGIGHH